MDPAARPRLAAAAAIPPAVHETKELTNLLTDETEPADSHGRAIARSR